MGFSVLSIVEIIYFVSIRPYFNRKSAKRSSQTKQKTLEQQEKDRKIKVMNKRSIMGTKIAWMKYDTTGVDNNYIPFPYTE